MKVSRNLNFGDISCKIKVFFRGGGEVKRGLSIGLHACNVYLLTALRSKSPFEIGVVKGLEISERLSHLESFVSSKL